MPEPLLSDSELATLLGDAPVHIPEDNTLPELDAFHHRTALLLGKRLRARFSPDLWTRAYSTESTQPTQQAGLTVLMQLQSPNRKPLPLAFTIDKRAAHFVSDLMLGSTVASNFKPQFSPIEERMLIRLTDALLAAIQLASRPLLPMRAVITHWLPLQNPLPKMTQQPLISATIEICMEAARTPLQIHWTATSVQSLWHKKQAAPAPTVLPAPIQPVPAQYLPPAPIPPAPIPPAPIPPAPIPPAPIPPAPIPPAPAQYLPPAPTLPSETPVLLSPQEQLLPPFAKLPLNQRLAQSRVRVSAELGTTSIPLEEFLQLKVGDTIFLDQAVDQPHQVLIEGIPFFEAVSKQQKLFLIENTF